MKLAPNTGGLEKLTCASGVTPAAAHNRCGNHVYGTLTLSHAWVVGSQRVSCPSSALSKGQLYLGSRQIRGQFKGSKIL